MLGNNRFFGEVFKALPAFKSHQKALSLLHNILKFVSRLPVVVDKAVEDNERHPDWPVILCPADGLLSLFNEVFKALLGLKSR